jgi:hypothetical protein
VTRLLEALGNSVAIAFAAALFATITSQGNALYAQIAAISTFIFTLIAQYTWARQD